MNELFDKLIIHIFFTLLVCLIIFIYRYVHLLIYPYTGQSFKSFFYPIKNMADSIHFFSKIIGIGLLFTEFHILLSSGVLAASFEFCLHSFFVLILYGFSLYVLDSVVLADFEYEDEINKRDNLSYALVSAINAISLAIACRAILTVYNESLILLFVLWFFNLVLLCLTPKIYTRYIKFSFKNLILQKSIGAAISYGGFILGWSIVIGASYTNGQYSGELLWYIMSLILKLFLAMIIFTLFKSALVFIFRIKETDGELKKLDSWVLGTGLYEGTVFLVALCLTSLIIAGIDFGTYYPAFN